MIKELWKKKSVKIWAIVSIALVGCMVAVPVVLNTALKNVLDFALGGPSPIFKDGEQQKYVGDYSTKTESLKNANEVNLQMNQEGMVLLKNEKDALPLKDGAKVSIFGKNSVNIAIGGSGSGAASGESVGIYESLEAVGYQTNPTLKEFYNDSKASGEGRSSNPGDLDSGKPVFLETGETPQSSYTDSVKSSYNEYSDAAVVVFTRIGGEGFDLPMTMKGATGARQEDDHFLQLDQNESDLLKAVCEANFAHVIVVLNSGSAMELTFLKDPTYYAYQDKIDAAIWMGYPGNSGASALGQIIHGDVNPSGRTTDTFAADFKKMPSFNNMSINRDSEGVVGDQYTLDGTTGKLYYFVDYEEGEYVGYRYYETRGYTDGEEWYDKNVVYPFGYGLSYTTFDWKIVDNGVSTTIDPTAEFDVQVEVTNTGSRAGKDVVELYATLPYTPGEIEKPYEVLIGFAKTSELAAGAKETVSIHVNPYYMASYDYKDANHNDFKGYELEKGTYELHFNKNAHENVLKLSMNVADDYQYDLDPVTDAEVTNLYTDQENAAFNSDTQLSTVLSRNDWEGTWPTTPTIEDQTVTQSFLDQLDDKTTNNPIDFDNDYDYPETDGDYGYSLYDLLYKDNKGEDGKFIYAEDGSKVRGDWVGEVDYDDPRWDDLLNQMKVSEVNNMFNTASYKIAGVDSVGLPYIACSDGPVGWTSFVNKELFANTASYCCGVTVAATWNQDLIEEFGKAVGQEGLVGNEKGTPYTGWYAPAMNIHRSPFGGRCFEYFSEDPLLSGKIAAAEVRGARSAGVVTFIKHFAANEQETHRSISGDCTWATEQALREIYFKPFEICVKEGHTLGVMSSFNRIGTRWTGGDYRLLTTILRDEWGFKGAVICDFNTIPSYMDPKQEAYAGGDLNLATMENAFWTADESSIGDLQVLRNIMHNVGYAAVNSNAMQGTVVGQTASKWAWMNYAVIFGFLGVIIVYGAIVILIDIHKIKNEKPLE